MSPSPTSVGVASLDPRTPILVGVGSASGDAEATELMSRALVTAGDDAGGRLLPQIDRLAVPQGSWSYSDPARMVAEAVGASSARTHLVELGIPQQSLINGALQAIAAGESEVAAVVGGEAKRWARDQARAGRENAETAQPGAVPDVVGRRPGPLMEPVEVAHRLWDPVQQYAMIDNALRSFEGHTLSQHRSEIAHLWEGFNRVARDNPDAAFPDPMDAATLDTPSASNRPLAFPYNKWHATQWTVNQAAALLLCSVEAAGRLGVPTDRWVFPLAGVESSHAVSLLRRRQPHAWPAMGVLGRAVAEHIGRPIAEVEIVEAYSCFPAAVRVQQRELALDRTAAPHRHRRDGLCRGPFQQLRVPVHGQGDRAGAGRAGGPRCGDHRQRPPDQAGHRRPGRPGPTADPRWWPTWGRVRVGDRHRRGGRDPRGLRGRRHRRHLHGHLRRDGARPHGGPV